MTSQPTDFELVDAARTGDRAALEALLERHQARIFRFGMKMCKNPSDAEDIVQDTMIAAVRTLDGFRGGSSVSTWLYTIARSFCIKKRRRSKFAPSHEASLDAEAEHAVRQVRDPGRGPETELEGRQTLAKLEEAIEALDPLYSEVLVLRDVEGLSAPEVAEVLSISVDAVKSRLHRARMAIREKVAPLVGGAPEQGKSCPDVVAALSQELEGDLSADRCAEMERHIEGCATCRARCDTLRQTLALCRSTATTEVPPAVQRKVRDAVRQFVAAQRPG